MTAGSPRGQARIQLGSRYAHTAADQPGVPGLAAARGTVAAQPLLLPPAGPCNLGRWWEQAYPGTPDQLGHVRAALRPLLRECPAADDILLVMHELAANAVRHSRSREHGRTFTARLLDVPGQYMLGEVEDGGSSWDGDLQGSARDASGLVLVLNLTSACGVSGDRRKRVVWFRVHYPPATTSP